jgi:hypothetical protein
VRSANLADLRTRRSANWLMLITFEFSDAAEVRNRALPCSTRQLVPRLASCCLQPLFQVAYRLPWHVLTLCHCCCASACLCLRVCLCAGEKSPSGCAYWGYTVTANLLPVVARVLHNSKLVLVFDIDETLLMAHTLDSLNTRLQRVRTER